MTDLNDGDKVRSLLEFAGLKIKMSYQTFREIRLRETFLIK